MPAESQAQQEFMGSQLEKAKEGKPHTVSLKVAKEFASTKRTGLPVRKSSGRKVTSGKR